MEQGALQYLRGEAPLPELSRIVRLDQITNTADTFIFDATPGECTSLAERFDLPYVRNLSAEITYRRTRSGQMIRVDGRITANYSQFCSATLLPMPVMMEETFQTEYTLVPWEKFSEFDLDQPEVLTDDFVDVGEIAAQYFGLAIDPYLRRAGTETLAELADSITEAARELTAQMEVAIAPLAAQPEPLLVPENKSMNGIAGILLAVEETEEESWVETATEEAEPEEGPPLAVSEAEAPESLFFRYLRQMQQG